MEYGLPRRAAVAAPADGAAAALGAVHGRRGGQLAGTSASLTISTAVHVRAYIATPHILCDMDSGSVPVFSPEMSESESWRCRCRYLSPERRYFLRGSPRPSARGMRVRSCGTWRDGFHELCVLLGFGLTFRASFLPRVLSRVSSASRPSVGCSGGRAHAGSLNVKLSMSIVSRYVLTRCLSMQAITSVIKTIAPPTAPDRRHPRNSTRVRGCAQRRRKPMRACWGPCKQAWPIAHRYASCRTILTVDGLRYDLWRPAAPVAPPPSPRVCASHSPRCGRSIRAAPSSSPVATPRS
jgi:hypothetical protein